MEFILSSQNILFFSSICLMLGLAAIEIFSALIGLPIFSSIDNLLPDGDIETELDTDIELASPPFYIAGLAWLNIGRIPLLVLVVLFLTSFGLIGYAIQGAAITFLGTLLSKEIASAISVIPSIFCVHIFGKWLEKLFPKEQSTAISQEDFIGKVATITIGTATKDRSAQAKLTDKYGQEHYIMVKPVNEYDTFPKGTKLILITKEKNIFIAEKYDM